MHGPAGDSGEPANHGRGAARQRDPRGRARAAAGYSSQRYLLGICGQLRLVLFNGDAAVEGWLREVGVRPLVAPLRYTEPTDPSLKDLPNNPKIMSRWGCT